MNTSQKKAPIWFWIIAIISLLWNIMGILSFVSHTFISEGALQALTQEERTLYNNYPIWISIIFATAVFTGVIASFTLLSRRKISLMIFQISLVAILIQMTYNIFFSGSLEVYGLVKTITMPLVVIVYAIFLVWFSQFSTSKSWLK